MLNSFCFMRLNTAGMVIGWLGAVFSFIMIILTSLILVSADSIANFIVKNFGLSIYDHDDIYMIIVVVYSLVLAFSLIRFISSTMLITGIVKERHLMLLPWLIGTSIEIIVKIIYKLILFIIVAAISNFGHATGIFMMSGIFLAIDIYIFCAIYSLYTQMQSNRDGKERPLIHYQQATNTLDLNRTYPSYIKI